VVVWGARVVLKTWRVGCEYKVSASDPGPKESAKRRLAVGSSACPAPNVPFEVDVVVVTGLCAGKGKGWGNVVGRRRQAEAVARGIKSIETCRCDVSGSQR
jgi:hypothetical protein